uniref:NADH-ubiquinone oxidoreductase chain 2 n=1 Tax=Peltocephalus dumerilianus TaxID=329145 RepID=A0A1Z4EAV3_9SAUR|nr:NADH dehydrogenase subunit 2 [Peltocephalus dumerilianus]
MNPNIYPALLINLLIGPIVTMSSSHSIVMWCGLEINSLSMVPLIAKPHHPRATEAAIKYFLIQVTASYILLFSIVTNTWHQGQWDIQSLTNTISQMALTLSMAIKLALAPFHLWFPEVLQGSTMTIALLLSTWQKVAPLTILMQCIQNLNPTILILIGISSTLAGGLGGLNQTQLRKIMAFSSIAHMGWLVSIMPYSTEISLLTFYIYITMTLTMFLMINTMKTNNFTTLMTSWTKIPPMNLFMMLTLMSLAGLPPLTGFGPKWLIIQELTKQHLTATATILALTSLLNLFFYLRISYYATITLCPNTTNSSQQWRHNTLNPTNLLAPATAMTTLLLPLMPMMMSTM